MANSKLPHERLRECASKSEGNDTFPSGWLIGCLLGDTYNVPVRECERKAFRKLANEVEDAIESAYMDGTCHYFDTIAEEQGWPERKDGELVEDYVRRCFLPRPRFEDGEPVQFGDDFCAGNMVLKAFEMVLYQSEWHLGNGLGTSVSGKWDAPVKRPAPKVLDADGVPIKAKTWMYDLCTGDRVMVLALLPSGDVSVEAYDDAVSDYVCSVNPSRLSLSEPDSLERLRNEMLVATKGQPDGRIREARHRGVRRPPDRPHGEGRVMNVTTKVCDRCGAEIDEAFGNKLSDMFAALVDMRQQSGRQPDGKPWRKARRVVLCHSGFFEDESVMAAKLDLCPECRRGLVDWFDSVSDDVAYDLLGDDARKGDGDA